MLAYLQLIRPLNCLMAGIAVCIGGWLVGGFSQELLLAAGIAFLITAGGNALNDYIDLEADKINKPGRPLPSKRITEETALIFSFLLFILGISLSTFLNLFILGIAILNSTLLVIYSVRLQDKLFLGNLTIAWLVGSTFLFGAAVYGRFLLPGFLALLAGLTTLSREIIKDFEDLEGDRQAWLKKLAKGIRKVVAERFKIGPNGVILKHRKAGLGLAGFALLLAVCISPFPWFLGLLSDKYLWLLIPADFCFLYSFVLLLKKRKPWSRMSKSIKIGMLLGLFAFLLGLF